MPGPGADKSDAAAQVIPDLRRACATPVARKSRCREIAARPLRHRRCALSPRRRERIEEAFDWPKTVGGMAQTICQNVEWLRCRFILTSAANTRVRRVRRTCLLPGMTKYMAPDPRAGKPPRAPAIPALSSRPAAGSAASHLQIPAPQSVQSVQPAQHPHNCSLIRHIQPVARPRHSRHLTAPR